jgi:hypothetical protein
MTREAPARSTRTPGGPAVDAPAAGGALPLQAMQVAWLDWTTSLLRNNQLPLSGNVDQWIRTWGEAVSQIGLLNVNIAGSRNPGLERKITSQYSYGRQLGRMLDVLAPLVDANQDAIGQKALADFHEMVRDISNARRSSVADIVAEVNTWQASPDFQDDLAELLQQLTKLSSAAR